MVYTVFYKTSSFAGYCFLSRYSIHPKRYGVFSFKVFIAVLVKIQICSFIVRKIDKKRMMEYKEIFFDKLEPDNIENMVDLFIQSVRKEEKKDVI